MPPESIETRQAIRDIADETRRAVDEAVRDRRIPWVRIGIGMFTAGCIVLGAVDPIKITNDSEGDSTLVAINDRRTVLIEEHTKYAYTHYEIDQLGPITNPEATRFGFYDRYLEYVPTGMLKLTAVDDKDLGFYILMQETDGKKDFDFDYSHVIIGTKKPEPCSIDNVDNKVKIPDYCTPLESPDSRGLEYSSAFQGQAFFNDTSVSGKARVVHDLRVDGNEWCDLSMIYGATAIGGGITLAETGDTPANPDDFSYNINNLNITQRTIFLGVRRAIIAAFRRDSSLQTGLPLTNAQGMPIHLTLDEVQMLHEVVKQSGKPIPQMTPDEYHTAVALSKSSLGEKFFPGEIDPGPTLALDLADFYSRDKNIGEPKSYDGKPITPENQYAFDEDYFCLPFVSKEGIEDSERVWWLKEKLGEPDELQPYAGLNIDPNDVKATDYAGQQADITDWPVDIITLDPVVAQQKITTFMQDAGLIPKTVLVSALPNDGSATNGTGG